MSLERQGSDLNSQQYSRFAQQWRLMRERASSGDLLDPGILHGSKILDLIRSEARRSLRWPVMRSKRPTFSSDEKNLFELIQLGDGLPYAQTPEKRSKWDALTKLAVELLEIVAQQGRFFRERQGRKYRERNRQIYEWYGELDCGLIFAGTPRPLEEWAEEAGRLKPFCKATVRDWWPFVARIFDERYPTLLQNTLKGLFEEETVPSKRKQDIREALLRRLEGLAKHIRCRT